MNAPLYRQQLALHGGLPIRQRPLAAWPHYEEDEILEATQVLRSGRVNQWTGSQVQEFEAAYARSLGRARALAVANGTLALELALVALGIGPGDEVIVPARTFIASVGCVVNRGARPVIADVDPVSGGLNAAGIEAVRSTRTRALIVVHVGGWPCDMAPIRALAARHRLWIVEDCAQAHGARLGGVPAGALGDIATFSFCQDKIISTGGEGGLLVMDREDWWQRAWSHRDNGKDWAAVHAGDAPADYRWVHHRFGTNARMTGLQAAIGQRQLGKLEAWVAQRRSLASRLREQLAGTPGLAMPAPGPGVEPSYYRAYVRIDTARLAPGWTLPRVIEAIQAEGIPCQSGTCSEIYREQAFREAGLGPQAQGFGDRLPGAKALAESSLAFAVHPTLAPEDMDDTAAAVRKVLAVALPA
jgi:dTDP-4-amino-4,6-dideoxygalactose transaminase